MATIKTIPLQSGRRILTKSDSGVKKVSCSCCVCCMYPAQAFFDGLYTQDDLPDSLTINPYDLGGTAVVQRNGLVYGPVQFFEGYSQRVTIKEVPFPQTPDYGPAWVLEATIGVGGGFTVLDDGPCLFQGAPANSGHGGITDLFEDTYEVTGPISGTVTRQSQCLWTGTDLRLSNFGYRWKVNGNKKNGLQNTPVGSYGEGYAVA